MPVDKQLLTALVDELGMEATVRASVLSHLENNEAAATQFVGQRMRHSDYTKKRQEESQQLQVATQQLEAYQAQLGQAQEQINKIVKDFETERISRSTAEARLQSVKTKYQLSDEDIPSVSAPPTGTAPKPEPTIDIEAKLAEFETKLLKTVRTDMLALPRVAVLQTEIAGEHAKLTGKQLTRKEWNELLATSEKEGRPLEEVWRDAHGIDKLRQDAHDREILAKGKEAWEAEQKKLATDNALAGAHQQFNPNAPQSLSPVIGRKFAQAEDGPDNHQQAAPVPDPAKPPANNPPAPPQRDARSGAERAAAKWTERRLQGVPLGQAEPVRK